MYFYPWNEGLVMGTKAPVEYLYETHKTGKIWGELRAFRFFWDAV
jgi:hypothetical protein